MLNLFHIAAAQQGNVIQVKTGWLGVDEACSGIRSLQAILLFRCFSAKYTKPWAQAHGAAQNSGRMEPGRKARVCRARKAQYGPAGPGDCHFRV